MTWRKFATLLRGLGPQSRTAVQAQVRHLARPKRRTITDPKEITATFKSLFPGPRKRTKH